jgi:hypothetical protein
MMVVAVVVERHFSKRCLSLHSIKTSINFISLLLIEWRSREQMKLNEKEQRQIHDGVHIEKRGTRIIERSEKK